MSSTATDGSVGSPLMSSTATDGSVGSPLMSSMATDNDNWARVVYSRCASCALINYSNYTVNNNYNSYTKLNSKTKYYPHEHV